jgi:hypothetical protein
MPKMGKKEVDRANAYVLGYDDYPMKDKKRYDYAKQPHAHTAYWNGWNAAAIDADRREQGLGGRT